MKPDKVIELSGGYIATFIEFTFAEGLLLLEEVERNYSGIDEIVFEKTDKLISFLPNAIKISHPDMSFVSPDMLAASDWDDIGEAFVQHNRSFFARQAMEKARQKAKQKDKESVGQAGDENPTTLPPSTDPLSR